MQNYLNLVKEVIDHGEIRDDRTGTGTRALFGRSLRFNLEDGFPAVTTKKLAWNSMLAELIWFMHGDTDVQNLRDLGSNIWNEWEMADGTIGPMYGYQWTKDLGHSDNQIKDVFRTLKHSPHSRRHIMTTFSPEDKDKGALYPCHGIVVQFYVSNDMKLSCIMHQRSADLGLGVPFNIASYALLVHVFAKGLGYGVGELIMNFGDVHVYNDHVDALKEQIKRTPKALPTLKWRDVTQDDKAFEVYGNKISSMGISKVDLFPKGEELLAKAMQSLPLVMCEGMPYLDDYEHYDTIKMQVSV